MANFELVGGGSGGLATSGGTMTGVIVLDGLQYHVTLVSDTDYTPNINDQIIVYTTLTATRNVVLTNLNVGQEIEVWDGTGNASPTKTINFNVSGSVSVNGTSSGSIPAVSVPRGLAIAALQASNTWVAQSAPIPGGLPSATPITVTGTFTWSQLATFNAGVTVAKNLNWGFVRAFFGSDVSTPFTVSAATAPLILSKSNVLNDVIKFPGTSGTSWFVINSATAATGTSIVLQDSASKAIDVLWPGSCAWVVEQDNDSSVNNKVVRSGPEGPLIDLTTQSAAITATTILTTQATTGAGGSGGPGLYRISWTAIVTQAATASSVLGGTAGFQITYTDNDTGASTTPPSIPNATATANTIGTQLSGDVVVNAKASTAIRYQFDYTSSGVTPMQYALHIRTEFLG